MARLDLPGKSILVTGAAGGIGAASARRLVERGARVTLVDLDREELDKVRSTMPSDRVLVQPADVTSYDQMQHVTDNAADRFGRLDVVFANAGVARAGTIGGSDLAELEHVIEVDLLGVLRTVKAGLPHVVAAGGHMLLTASIYAICNGVINSPYAASKSAVESLGRSLRLELAVDGATAGVLYPGWVSTPISAVVRGEDPDVTALKERAFRGPLGRFIEPDRVAAAVVRGIERRAARVFEPRGWAAYSLLRGVLDTATDVALARDPRLRELVGRIDRAGARERVLVDSGQRRTP